MKNVPPTPPLSNATTFILLALAERDLHGYGILQETLRQSGGSYRMGPGTLYDNLKTLMAGGVVAELEGEDAAHDPRRLYRLTSTGAALLADELKRLDHVVKAGRARLASGRAKEA